MEYFMQKELQNPKSQDASIFPPQNDRETIPVLEKVSFVSQKQILAIT
jgi:hypothetical protein